MASIVNTQVRDCQYCGGVHLFARKHERDSWMEEWMPDAAMPREDACQKRRMSGVPYKGA